VDKTVRACDSKENETNTYRISVGKPEVNKPI
jgi:histidinol-phosphate/aromatic aminotransferase/cobyric acid decarboxylase-like protein